MTQLVLIGIKWKFWWVRAHHKKELFEFKVQNMKFYGHSIHCLFCFFILVLKCILWVQVGIFSPNWIVLGIISIRMSIWNIWTFECQIHQQFAICTYLHFLLFRFSKGFLVYWIFVKCFVCSHFILSCKYWKNRDKKLVLRR